jgi:hypothetical protein
MVFRPDLSVNHLDLSAFSHKLTVASPEDAGALSGLTPFIHENRLPLRSAGEYAMRKALGGAS